MHTCNFKALSILYCMYWCICTTVTTALVLLSDLATPAFLIDVQAVQKRSATTDIPPILLPKSNQKLVAVHVGDATPQHSFDDSVTSLEILDTHSTQFSGISGDVCFGYIHCKVVSRKPRQTSNPTAFLAELDYASTNTPALLVLGLNNHHVISYYWARSVGAGAAMEAPGVEFKGNTLQWKSDGGFTMCNSNDGKRSEWVKFLRVGDQVQLRPECFEEALLSSGIGKIYGISSAGRPLGSEPVVVCEWTIEPLR